MAIVALSLILAVTWFISDTQKGTVEKALSRSNAESVKLMEEIEARDLRIEELNLSYEAEKKRLASAIKEIEQALKDKESERTVLASERDALESRLRTAETKLGELNEELVRKERKTESENEEFMLSFEKMQESMRDASARGFRDELTELEVRLSSLSRKKSMVDNKWSEAMQALVNMEDAARSMEASLTAGGRPDGLEEAGTASISRLRSDIEALRRSMKDTMAAETEMIEVETSSISQKLDKMYSEARLRALEREPGDARIKEEDPFVKVASIKGADLGSLGSKIEYMKTLADIYGTAVPDRGRGWMPPGPADGSFEEYVVRRGDTLWGIASRENVYGNPYLWPILYRYNASRIKSPDVIVPESKIFVKRGINQEDMALAVGEARGDMTRTVKSADNWLKALCAP
ncbi:MAG: LysM peptidoglycan-binding domain-containing protein [Deltaproteobacteria bacterium]|nr:LysM peptidoglycan-binding domain-containing protein [Deltaproteobacteria bacterium]MBZ0219619.1 LysM peptidoglycan-binding domain-containing protein [Deltaproteobacteria bacterium]